MPGDTRFRPPYKPGSGSVISSIQWKQAAMYFTVTDNYSKMLRDAELPEHLVFLKEC